ncbi:MAG: hypothetical protein DRP08_07935 [Candidatus Aenigmatarchaeota archaeon]|nr:MAG: hypothetical protein DRP08_07935 [Candidatus Aenigmarchaeota archaeon]
MKATTTILVVLLIIRLFGQIFQMAALIGISFLFVIPLVFGILYGVALVGILKKQRWGLILVMLIAGIDLLVALIIGGASGIGAGVVDLLLLLLGYKEYSTAK